MPHVTPSPPPLPGQLPSASRVPFAIPLNLRRTLQAVVLVLILLNGVLLMLPGAEEPKLKPPNSSGAAVTTKTITDAQRRFELTVPSHWTIREQKELDLFTGSESEDLVIVVFSESREALRQLNEDYHEVDAYSAHVRKLLAEGFPGGSQTEPRRLTINGLVAVQAEVEGQQNGEKLTFLHTVLETPTHFYVVRAFTTTPRFPDAKPILMEVVSSFRLRSSPN